MQVGAALPWVLKKKEGLRGPPCGDRGPRCRVTGGPGRRTSPSPGRPGLGWGHGLWRSAGAATRGPGTEKCPVGPGAAGGGVRLVSRGVGGQAPVRLAGWAGVS